MVMVNINHTRLHLQNTKEGAFNYILQADRSFDRLNYSIHDYLSAETQAQKQAIWPQLKLRFDLIWSTFQVFDIHLPSGQRLDIADDFTANVKLFLSQYDPVFSSNQAPANAQLQPIENRVRDLSTDLLTVGNNVFASFNVFRDHIAERMEKLYQYFWVSALLLLITGSALVTQLFRLNNRSTRLYNDAQNSKARLATVVEELRSGKREQKAKDSFLAAASHDLRQPLHALGLFVSALENKVKVPDGPIILGKIKQSTEALSDLLNSLLDLSRLDAGVVEPSPGHFYCSRLFLMLHEEFKEVADSSNIYFRIEHSDEIAFTDYILLERILRNLIDNAITHTKQGKVVVSCTKQKKYLHIEVLDTGPGIPLDEQEAIFSEYYQLDNPERDRSKGLGLGLAIVRRLSDLLGIELTMRSQFGEGTRFLLKVPAGQASDIPVNAIEPMEQSNDLNGALVLVIDDEQSVRDGMELLLKKINCTIVAVESGEAAQQVVVEQSLIPDLVIADYRLREGKTGDEAVELVREELNLDIPALIVTGDTSPERVRDASESGMRLLHKPVQPEELVKVVESFLSVPEVVADSA